MIDYRQLYGAEEDSFAPITRFSFTDFRSLFWSPLSRVWKSEEFLNQDEFMKNSKFCTLYAARYSYVHWFGKLPLKIDRKTSLNYMLDTGVISEKKWWNPLKTAKAFVHRFNTRNKEYEARISYFNAWSHAERMLMIYWHHWFIAWFTISDDFADDRRDDMLLDWNVHWWKTYWWHAIFEVMPNPWQLLIMNNYEWRHENHFWLKWYKFIDKRYNKKYHYKYSALITYRPK